VTRRARSRRAELAQLREELRAQGWTYRQIAVRIRDEQHVNMRVAFRLAHGWTQAQVAERWNARWPDAEAPKTGKHISYWETWPTPSGRAPSLDTLDKLARLYQCSARDLLDGTDYSDQDAAAPATANLPAVRTTPASRPSAAPALLRSGELVPMSQPSPSPVAIAVNQPGVLPEPVATLVERLGSLVVASDHQYGLSAQQRDAAFQQLIEFFMSWAQTMDRRAFLRNLSFVAAAAATAPIFADADPDDQARLAAVIQQPGRVDDQVIDHIEQVLWAAMRQDDTLGPQAALDTVLAQRNLVRVMLRDCPANLRSRLLSVFANLSGYAGWLAFDLGDLDGASYYYEEARTVAHEAHDSELGALVLCNMSHLATWRGRPRVGIDHAVAAQGWANRTSNRALQAYAADRAARAFAADGERIACFDALAQAETALGRPEQAASNQLMYFYDHGLLTSSRSLCLVDLGDTTEAIRQANQSLAMVDTSFVRNRAFTMSYLSTAYAAADQIEDAADCLGDAALLATRNHSARLVKQVRSTRAGLAPWADSRAVRRLDERLQAYGLS
jgi:transcriptional regulator with XRE-family HTH domain